MCEVLVIAAQPARSPRPDGFSLLEVVVAASLLLLTVTSVSAAVASVSHSGRRAEAAMKVGGVLESVVAHLGSVPFCPAALPAAPEAGGLAATDLLAAVFPAAGASRDAVDARYVEADEGGLAAGSFFTRFEEDGVVITCVARFRRAAGGVWLGSADLDGWDLALSDRPPAPLLVVEVTAAAGGVTRTARLLREAGVDPVPDSSPIPAVGP
jgi:hypothetical protein